MSIKHCRIYGCFREKKFPEKIDKIPLKCKTNEKQKKYCYGYIVRLIFDAFQTIYLYNNLVTIFQIPKLYRYI